MDLLHSFFVTPFQEMGGDIPLTLGVIWEGLVSGILYALVALGFVLIFKASGVFNFAQGIMVVFAALTLVSLYAWLAPAWGFVGISNIHVQAWVALGLTVCVMALLAVTTEKVVLRKLVNMHDAILLMATIGLARFLTGFGQFIYGGDNKTMITEELGLPTGSIELEVLDGVIFIEELDIAAAVIATTMVIGLAIFFNKTRIGRALRAVADDHQAALSVGISLNQIWAIVWFAAGIVALVTGVIWGARADVSFALEIVALKALAVLIIGGFTSIPGAIVAGIIVGVSEKIFEIYWGDIFGGGVEAWFAYVLALIFLLFRPQGLFGEKIIERI